MGMTQTNIVISPHSTSKEYQLYSTQDYVNHKSKFVTAPNTGILLHKIILPSYSLANIRLKMEMCKQQFKVEWTCLANREFLQ